jgi:hypothetical protein
MQQHRFRFSDYSEKRLYALRWCLFSHPEVQDVAYVEKDVVAISFVGEPRVREWLEHVSANGYQLNAIADVATAAA